MVASSNARIISSSSSRGKGINHNLTESSEIKHRVVATGMPFTGTPTLRMRNDLLSSEGVIINEQIISISTEYYHTVLYSERSGFRKNLVCAPQASTPMGRVGGYLSYLIKERG